MNYYIIHYINNPQYINVYRCIKFRGLIFCFFIGKKIHGGFIFVFHGHDHDLDCHIAKLNTTFSMLISRSLGFSHVL